MKSKSSNNYNKTKNVKSRKNKKNSVLRKYKNKSQKKLIMKGGVIPTNPLKILSFYFYKLIIKAAKIFPPITHQLNIFVEDIRKKYNKNCTKITQSDVINICVKMLQKMSIYGFITAPNPDIYITAKLNSLKTKLLPNSCDNSIIEYFIQVSKKGSIIITSGQNVGIPGPPSPIANLMKKFAGIASNKGGNNLEDIGKELGNIGGKLGITNTELISNAKTMFGNMLSKSTDIIQNLETESKYDAIDLLCEGPIEGFVDSNGNSVDYINVKTKSKFLLLLDI